jgi:hypothetical protein
MAWKINAKFVDLMHIVCDMHHLLWTIINENTLANTYLGDQTAEDSLSCRRKLEEFM